MCVYTLATVLASPDVREPVVGVRIPLDPFADLVSAGVDVLGERDVFHVERRAYQRVDGRAPSELQQTGRVTVPSVVSLGVEVVEGLQVKRNTATLLVDILSVSGS